MTGETIGLVCDIKKQWWLGVSTKSFYLMKEKVYPHVIKIKYNVEGREYFCYKWLNPREKVPHFGDRVIVVYNKEKPSKGKIKEFCQERNSR